MDVEKVDAHSIQGNLSRIERPKRAARNPYDRLSRWYDFLAGSETRYAETGL